MKTTLTIYSLGVAALLAGGALSGLALAGDKPRSDAMHGDAMHGADEMRADKDGDGRVSRAEATAAATERTNAWFDKLDLDKDGYVTKEESTQARETRHGDMRAKADEHFKAADANGDGSLSLDEVQAKMPKMADRFSTLDKDKNGLLSREEMKRGGGHGKPEPKN